MLLYGRSLAVVRRSSSPINSANQIQHIPKWILDNHAKLLTLNLTTGWLALLIQPRYTAENKFNTFLKCILDSYAIGTQPRIASQIISLVS